MSSVSILAQAVWTLWSSCITLPPWHHSALNAKVMLLQTELLRFLVSVFKRHLRERISPPRHGRCSLLTTMHCMESLEFFFNDCQDYWKTKRRNLFFLLLFFFPGSTIQSRSILRLPKLLLAKVHKNKSSCFWVILLTNMDQIRVKP